MNTTAEERAEWGANGMVQGWSKDEFLRCLIADVEELGRERDAFSASNLKWFEEAKKAYAERDALQVQLETATGHVRALLFVPEVAHNDDGTTSVVYTGKQSMAMDDAAAFLEEKP